jgi:hypothetical protein
MPCALSTKTQPDSRGRDPAISRSFAQMAGSSQVKLSHDEFGLIQPDRMAL